MKFDATLYLVTGFVGRTEKDFLNCVDLACKGGVTIVQLREKELSGAEYLRLAFEVKKITDKYKIPLIIDDRVDVALACDCAGVHVGAEDLPVSVARKLMGEDKIVGATAKTVDAAKLAYQQGADYLGVGAIYPTTTKVKTKITTVETLNEIRKNVPIPVVAIGGLNTENLDILQGSMADGVAVVSAIMKAAEPQKATEQLKISVRNTLNK